MNIFGVQRAGQPREADEVAEQYRHGPAIALLIDHLGRFRGYNPRFDWPTATTAKTFACFVDKIAMPASGRQIRATRCAEQASGPIFAFAFTTAHEDFLRRLPSFGKSQRL